MSKNLILCALSAMTVLVGAVAYAGRSNLMNASNMAFSTGAVQQVQPSSCGFGCCSSKSEAIVAASVACECSDCVCDACEPDDCCCEAGGCCEGVCCQSDAAMLVSTTAGAEACESACCSKK